MKYVSSFTYETYNCESHLRKYIEMVRESVITVWTKIKTLAVPFSRITLMQDERNSHAWDSSAGLSRIVRTLSGGGGSSIDVISTKSLFLTT